MKQIYYLYKDHQYNTAPSPSRVFPVQKHSIHQCRLEQVIVCYRGVYIHQSKEFLNLIQNPQGVSENEVMTN